MEISSFDEQVAQAFVAQYISGAQGCEMDFHAAQKLAEAIRALLDRLTELKAERDELDALYHEGGAWEQQLSKAEARAESASPQAAEAQQRLETVTAAARPLMERWEHYLTTHMNYECAYHALAKGQWEKWDALRAALSEEPKP